MTPVHPANTEVSVTVDHPVPGVTGISYTVMDAAGVEVAPEASATVDGTSVTVTVPANLNTLEDGEIRGIRKVRLTFASPTGPRIVDSLYVIEAVSKLIVMQNSFQTYEEALLTRFDLPDLDGWDLASEAARLPALVTAHDRMCRLSYRYRLGQNAVEYRENVAYWYLTDIRLRTADEFATWPGDFKSALRRAQVYEANQILNGDPVGDKRRDGVVSETIGEAKMFFNPRPPLRLALCREAMETLAGHLYSNRRIGRA